MLTTSSCVGTDLWGMLMSVQRRIRSLTVRYVKLRHDLEHLFSVRDYYRHKLSHTQDEYMEDCTISSRDMEKLYRIRERRLSSIEREINRKSRRLQNFRNRYADDGVGFLAFTSETEVTFRDAVRGIGITTQEELDVLKGSKRRLVSKFGYAVIKLEQYKLVLAKCKSELAKASTGREVCELALESIKHLVEDKQKQVEDLKLKIAVA